MPAILLIALALLVGGVTLSAKIRNIVINALAGVRDYIVGAWPTWAQFRQATGPVWITLLVLLGLAVASWFLFFIVMLAVGIMVKAPVAGLLIGLVFPAWCLLYIVRNFLGRLISIPYWIATIILLVAIPSFVLGAWSPHVKGEFGRWTGNKKGELANAFGKSSIQSEPEAGIIGFANEDGVVVYNMNDRQTPIKQLGSGDAVMIISLKGRPVDEDAEGMVPVKLANKYGDFNGKLGGWVVSRKISWNKPRRPELFLPPPPPPPPVYLPPMPAPTPPPPVVVPKPVERPEWEMCETAEDSYIPGPNKSREKCFPATVKLEKHNREITVTRHDGATTVFHGFAIETEGVMEGVMEGQWSILAENYDGNGKFHLEFDLDQVWEYARGWRIINKQKTTLELKRRIMLRDHE